MESEQVQKIHKDMTIADILQIAPSKTAKLAELMTDAGLHCVGCGASTFETLEQGLLGHGYAEEQLVDLLAQLNEVLNEDAEEVSTQDMEDITPLKFTQNGITKVKEIMKSENKSGWGLRVAILPGGCSGSTYELSFQEKSDTHDKVIEQEGVKLFVDQDSYRQLNGVVVDFVNNLNESGFKFDNPQAKGGCGCGKSFN